MNGRGVLGAMAITVSTVLLAACGGGGGGGDGGSGPPGSIDISTANRQPITRAALVTVQGGLVGGSLGIAGSAPSTAVALRAAQRVLLAGARSGAARESAAAVIGPERVDCAVSGFVTFTLDDRDGNQAPSVGDVLQATFSACSDVAGESISGGMSATYTQAVASPLNVGAAVTVNNLTAVEDTISTILDGAFALTVQEVSASVTAVRMTVSNALSLRASAPAYTDTVTMTDGYRIDITEDLTATPPGGGSAGRSTTTVSGRLSSTAAGGSVTVSTFEPFEQYTDDAYPRAGVLEALGKNGSLQARVVSTSEVRIDIDANGDGTTDDTITVPWSQLL